MGCNRGRWIGIAKLKCFSSFWQKCPPPRSLNIGLHTHQPRGLCKNIELPHADFVFYIYFVQHLPNGILVNWKIVNMECCSSCTCMAQLISSTSIFDLDWLEVNGKRKFTFCSYNRHCHTGSEKWSFHSNQSGRRQQFLYLIVSNKAKLLRFSASAGRNCISFKGAQVVHLITTVD